jgi:hypothetical protein
VGLTAEIANMKKRDRLSWLTSWFMVHQELPFDVLNDEFVNAYIEATSADYKIFKYGAPQCKQLGRDLGYMQKQGILTRSIIGLFPGDSSMGFPKWVYVYRLKKTL